MEGYDNKMAKLNQELTYLITGGAGFIGFHVAKHLLRNGARLLLVDNFNPYYDLALKEARIRELEVLGLGDNLIRLDIAEHDSLFSLFEQHRPDIVLNLAAQAGVRYSIDHPEEYIRANVEGFFNLLEACRHYPVRHLVYASSSSVYGMNKKIPFSTEDKTDTPVSLYAATKKSGELMAHAYAKLYGIPVTGLRFFTVYGPFGRPDMAYYKFAKKIMAGEPIEIYNHGEMKRDFTYVEDVAEAVCRILPSPPEGELPCRLYNIGNHTPVRLMEFVELLEKLLGKEAEKIFLPMQPGDVEATWADVSELERDFGFAPKTPLNEGLARFAEWFLNYEG